MEEAAAVRRAALEAVDDVEPDRLVERIGTRLEGGSMAPGVLTFLSADAVEKGIATEAVADRAAGVQLIYEGLRLTRTLAHSQPWVEAGSDDWQSPADERLATNGGGKSAAAAAADIDILVADILVARGFYVLARTEAADTAVSVVRSFGRDQTVRREIDDPTLDDNLEADVLELAVVAGTTAAGGDATASLREFATGLVTGDGSLPSAETLFPETITERLDGLTSADTSAGSARTSADH